MFGYVRPLRGELKVKDWEGYEAQYCALCHCLKERCGFAARFTLNYDFVFLALLLDDGEERPVCRRRCAAHPFRKRPCAAPSAAMELCADQSVILACYKLRDGIADEGVWRGLGYRAGALLLGYSYRRAKRAQPEFDRHTADCLRELAVLEGENYPQLDRVADTFARLLAGAAPKTDDPQLDRPREQLLYHLGRWIYLLDALDDLDEDVRKGRYNPVAARFGGEVDREYLDTTLHHSLSLAQSAFQLLPRRRWAELLENILYLGLPSVQKSVLDGTWSGGEKMSGSIKL